MLSEQKGPFVLLLATLEKNKKTASMPIPKLLIFSLFFYVHLPGRRWLSLRGRPVFKMKT